VSRELAAPASRATCHYRLYGLSVRSAIPLGFPEHPAGGGTDVTCLFAPRRWFAEITAGRLPDEMTDGWYKRIHCADGSEYLRWPGLFEFNISHDGRLISCGLLEGAAVDLLRTYLLGPVLSFALLRQGYEPLHATTVVVDAKAVAFLGESGSGKSTLAAAFLRAGHRLLTDDLFLIGDVNGILCGFPGPPRIKLFPDVAQRFVLGRGACATVNPETDKLIIPLEPEQCDGEPVPLHGFFVLDEPERSVSGVHFASQSGAQSLLRLVRSTFNARVVSQDRLRRQFLAVHDWAARIPMWKLTYPRTLETLAQVCDTIVSDIRVRGNQSL
jgi:hypothetical protein